MKPVKEGTVAGGLIGRQEFPHPIALRDGDTFTFAYELTASDGDRCFNRMLARPLRCSFCGTFLKLDEHGVCAHCGGPPKGWSPRGTAGVLMWDGTQAELAKVKELWRQKATTSTVVLPKHPAETSFTVR